MSLSFIGVSCCEFRSRSFSHFYLSTHTFFSPSVTASSENTAFQAPQAAQALDNELIDRIRSSVLSLSNEEGEVFATVIVWDYTDSEVLLLTNYHTWDSYEYKYCFPPKLPAKKSTSKPKASLKRKAQEDEDEDENNHVVLTLGNNDDFDYEFIVTSDVFHSWEKDEDFVVLTLPKAGFTMPRIPISLGVSLNLKIHAFGYVGHTKQFNVSGGEISGLLPDGFAMNLLSAGGYSGAAIIADSCGRAVGYMGGNLDASKEKNSQQQSYGYRFDRVFHATGRELTTPTNSPTCWKKRIYI